MTPSALPTKMRVYKLLKDGHTASGAADILGLASSTVKEHAYDLVSRGALRSKVTPGRATYYERGARAGIYEVQIRASETGRPGRSGVSPDAVANLVGRFRIHNGTYKAVTHTDGPRRDPPGWVRTENKGTVFLHGSIVVQGRHFRIQESRGRVMASVLITPEPQTVESVTDKKEVEKWHMGLAREALAVLESEFGYRPLNDHLERKGELEYGYPQELLPANLGLVGRSGAWTDGSAPGPSPELEGHHAVMAAVEQGPLFQKVTSDRLKHAEERLDQVEHERLEWGRDRSRLLADLEALTERTGDLFLAARKNLSVVDLLVNASEVQQTTLAGLSGLAAKTFTPPAGAASGAEASDSGVYS